MNQIFNPGNGVMDDINFVINISPGLQDCIDLVNPYFQTPLLSE